MTTPRSLPDGPAGRGPLLDFARAFSFFFEDPDWVKKILIGSVLCLLVPLFVGWLLLAGYVLGVIRRTAAAAPRPLPEFDDWGGLFRDGFKVTVVYFGHLAAVLSVPVLILLAAYLMTGGFVARRHAPLEGLFGLGVMLAYLLLIVLALALAVYMPSALARLARTDSIGAAFQVRENVAFIGRNLGNYGLTLVLYLITSLATQIGLLLCCVGILPATVWATCVAAWAIGSTLRLDPGASIAVSR